MTRRSKKLRGTVKKVIKSVTQEESDKAEIEIEEADPLYREIRIENSLQSEDGAKVSLKPGAEVNVVLEAEAGATVEEHESKEKKSPG